MDLKTKDGMFVVTEKDYQVIHSITHKWAELHGRYFKTGKVLSEISTLFNQLGAVDGSTKTDNK